MIAVQILGGFSAIVGGENRGATLPRKLASILGVVAASGERGIARDRLLQLFWTDAEPERARHALTQSLYALRRALGDESIVSGTAHLVLNPSVATTDLAALDEAMQRGDGGAILTLYRGALLEGLVLSTAPEFERWLDEERRALHHRVLHALDLVARTHRATGDHGSEAMVLRQRVAHDPLDATASLALMRALADAGDTPAAVQHARIYSELVRQELELEPDARIAQLAVDLQERASAVPRPATATPVSVVPAAVARRWEALLEHARRGMSALWVRRSNVPRRLIRQALGAASFALIVLLALARYGEVRARVAPTGTEVAVLPFRPIAVAPELGFLATGMVELLGQALEARDTLPVVDAAVAIGRWTPGTGTIVPDTLAAVARSLHAGRLVTGTIVGNAQRLMVRATLHDARGGTLAHAVSEGSLDSLSSVVGRLATRLVTEVAGAGDAAPVHDVSPDALRAWLAGRAAYRRAEWGEARERFAYALARDSTLAVAAVGLALAADWLEDAEEREAALGVAERQRAALPLVERLQLIALRGPAHPAPARTEEYFAAWERVALAGQRVELWADLGRRYLVDGEAAGVPRPLARAAAAFARARELDTLDVGTQVALAALALAEGPPAVRDGASLTWRDRARADTGLAEPLHRWARVNETLAEHANALNAGDSRATRSFRQRLTLLDPSGAGPRLVVLDALYGHGDTVEAAAQVAQLAARARLGANGGPDLRRVAIADLCVVEQWRAWKRDWSTMDATLEVLAADTAGAGAIPLGVSGPGCAVLLTALREGLRPEGDAGALARAEQLGMAGRTSGDLRQYATLALGRLRAARGELEPALALARRTPRGRGWPRYLASYLHLEASVAARLQDAAAERMALQRYLALRTAPDSSLAAEVDAARARLRALEGPG